jgi:hypothetical protein
VTHLFSLISSFSFYFKSSVSKDKGPHHSSSCILVLPSSNNRQHFPMLSSFIMLSPHSLSTCLWIFARQTVLAFKNYITDRIFQVVGFSIFIFNDYNEWGKHISLYYTINMFPLTHRMTDILRKGTHLLCSSCAQSVFILWMHLMFHFQCLLSGVPSISARTSLLH